MNCVTFVQENHTQHNRGILQNYEKKNHTTKLFSKPTSGYPGVLQDLAQSEYQLLCKYLAPFAPLVLNSFGTQVK